MLKIKTENEKLNALILKKTLKANPSQHNQHRQDMNQYNGHRDNHANMNYNQMMFQFPNQNPNSGMPNMNAFGMQNMMPFAMPNPFGNQGNPMDYNNAMAFMQNQGFPQNGNPQQYNMQGRGPSGPK